MKKYDVYVGGNYVGTQELTFEEVRKINEDSDIVLITKQQSKLAIFGQSMQDGNLHTNDEKPQPKNIIFAYVPRYKGQKELL